MYTQVQIKSYCNRNVIYAEAGEWVNIIEFSFPVYAVELRGNKFPCHMDKLGLTKPGEVILQPKVIVPGNKKKPLLPDPSRIRRKLSQAEQMQLEYLKNERAKQNNG